MSLIFVVYSLLCALHAICVQKEIELIKRRVQGVVDAAKFVMVEYNVIRSKLSLVLQITPGKVVWKV